MRNVIHKKSGSLHDYCLEVVEGLKHRDFFPGDKQTNVSYLQ